MRFFKFFLMLDLFVLNRCEKFSHSLYRLTGRDNFWLAKVSLILLLVLSFIDFGIYIAWTFPFFGIMIRHMFLAMKSIEPKHENVGKVNYLIHRLWMLLGFIIFLEWSNLLFTLFYYFISCTPLPPSESKFKKWVKNMVKSLKRPINVSQPIPIPVSN